VTKDEFNRLFSKALSLSNTRVWMLTQEQVEDFASIVAEAEREACALIAESYEPTCDSCPSGVANAIRGRS